MFHSVPSLSLSKVIACEPQTRILPIPNFLAGHLFRADVWVHVSAHSGLGGL